MNEILSIVCDHLLRASNEKVASLVKSVENSLLHVPAVYASQLAKAYPHLDTNEVLRLASTHWRINLYYPTLGTGGYCIPLSSKYVLEGARDPEKLTILQTTLQSDSNEPYFLANKLAERIRGKIGIMGISYKGDLKVHTLSPALKIIERLKQSDNLQVLVNDPYYSPAEIQNLFKLETFDFEKDLGMFSAIVIVTDHKVYGRLPLTCILEQVKKECIVIDNYGIWGKHRKALHKAGIHYYRVGDPGWTLD
jgi:UDP-N-acetyl-D-mannosaminuronate dehydrogenase